MDSIHHYPSSLPVYVTSHVELGSETSHSSSTGVEVLGSAATVSEVAASVFTEMDDCVDSGAGMEEREDEALFDPDEVVAVPAHGGAGYSDYEASLGSEMTAYSRRSQRPAFATAVTDASKKKRIDISCISLEFIKNELEKLISLLRGCIHTHEETAEVVEDCLLERGWGTLILGRYSELSASGVIGKVALKLAPSLARLSDKELEEIKDRLINSRLIVTRVFKEIAEMALFLKFQDQEKLLRLDEFKLYPDLALSKLILWALDKSEFEIFLRLAPYVDSTRMISYLDEYELLFEKGPEGFEKILKELEGIALRLGKLYGLEGYAGEISLWISNQT